MNKELKEKWVAALRSGEYEQGREHLMLHGAYCCLGVLCKVAGAEWTAWEDGPIYIGNAPVLNGLPLITADGDEELSEGALKLFGFSQADQVWLSKMNDGVQSVEGVNTVRRHSFSEIADYIEANL